MAIYGYSERGIINSLIFAIGDNVQLMTDFINSINILKPFDIGVPESYDVLLEQSFSRFGSADLVIIIKYNNSLQTNKVLFIEGKVKTSQKTYWNLENQYKEFEKRDSTNSSNLFFQLHLKKLLIENTQEIENTIHSKEQVVINELWYQTKRKIGKNTIVEKAFNMVKVCEAYYIGLIPSSTKDITTFTNKINNKDNDAIEHNIHFLSWHTVKNFCDKQKHKRVFENVILNFEYNENQIFNEFI